MTVRYCTCGHVLLFDVYHTVLGGMYYDCSMSIILYLGACIVTVRCLSYCT